MSRSCTADHKIKVVGKYIKSVVPKAELPVEVFIGISVDEIERAGRGKDERWEIRKYPLLDLGLRRSDCINVIQDAGLPVPPKSSCFFCPFHRPLMWAEMRRDEPELFWKSAELEATLNKRRDKLGKDHVYLTRFAKPLPEAIAEAQDMLPFGSPDIETCDEGYCWT